MKRIFALLMAGFCVCAGIYAYKNLPAGNDEAVEKKYDAWAGVIRVWAAEECGAAGWLNECAAIFERRTEGVYISVQQAPLSAITGWRESGINPPDIIVRPAGTDIGGVIIPITRAYPLRGGLRSDGYSAPLFVRPRFWIYDADAYPTLPGDMRGVRAACRPGDAAALVALCTGLRPVEGSAHTSPGVDLGLAGASETEPPAAGGIECRVSPGLEICAAPGRLYTEGSIDAFVGGVDDALLLRDSRATKVCVTGDYICADSAVLSIVEKGDGREAACMAFLDVLMGEGQTLLARAKAFPAVSGASAWAGDMMLGPAEAALEGRALLVGITGGDEEAYLFIQGMISADGALERIVGGK